MAKSLRSKAKRTARRAKRETANSAFAIQEAARLDRLNAKLTARTLLEPEPVHNSREDGSDDEEAAEEEAMVVEDASEQPTADGSGKPISTHGPRNSGRERWRKSKGLAPRKKKNVNGPTNKQGVLPATKRAGRSKRRR